GLSRERPDTSANAKVSAHTPSFSASLGETIDFSASTIACQTFNSLNGVERASNAFNVAATASGMIKSAVMTQYTMLRYGPGFGVVRDDVRHQFHRVVSGFPAHARLSPPTYQWAQSIARPPNLAPSDRKSCLTKSVDRLHRI